MGNVLGKLMGGAKKPDPALAAAQQRQLARTEASAAEEERKKRARISALTERSRGRSLLLSDESRGSLKETLG